MDYTRFLPDSPQALARWELAVWLVAGLFGVAAIALGFVARGISQHRGVLVQARFDKSTEALSRTVEEEARKRADAERKLVS